MKRVILRACQIIYVRIIQDSLTRPKGIIPILMFIITLGLAGCKSQTPSVDPFFGRTTVPPPPTGSVSGQAADPYYQPFQSGALQANAPYKQNGISTGSTNAPSYSGSTWTNPSNTAAGSSAGSIPSNQSNAPRYYSPGSSVLTGPSTPGASGAAGNSAYSMQPASQTNPAAGTSNGGYIPRATPAQPTSMPSTLPGSNMPGTNQYTPPSGSQNYNYPGNAPAGNLQMSSPSVSPNRVSTPFFNGGVPNRKTIPVSDNNLRASDYAGTLGTAGVTNPPNYNPNMNSYQYGAPPQGNNSLMPMSRQSTVPTPAQPKSNSTQSGWRESTSSDTRMTDDNVEPASNTETK
jgi:hypothetical protein